MKKKHESLILGYSQYGTLEGLHRRSRLWLSELAFWQDELSFMYKLVNSHFVYFIDAQRNKIVLEMNNEIELLRMQLNSTREKVLQHEKDLKHLLQAPDEEKAANYRREHGELELVLEDFLTSYKTFKKLLFAKADEVLQEEKMQRIISLSG